MDEQLATPEVNVGSTDPVATGVATFEARIAPELQQFVRPLSDAARHPDNIRKHRIDKIAQSLRAHGQRAAIVVQASTGLIVKGNGTHEAAELLGWTEIAQIWQEMTDAEAIGFLYADNKTSDFSTYDRKRTIAGLQKLVAGPGLFDTLWEIEELEDLVEAEEGMATLEPQATTAALATTTKGGAPLTADPAKPPERMKEVPLVMTIADHGVFVEQLKKLAKVYGTNGTIATIVEAVRRAVATVEAGTALTPDGIYAAKREVVVDLRNYIAGLDPTRSFSATWLMAQLEEAVPYRPDKPKEVPGQTTLEELVADPEIPVVEAVPVVSPLRAPEVVTPDEASEASPEDDAEALAALARFRASQPA